MLGGCFGAYCLGRPDWGGFRVVHGYDDLVKLMGGAGGGSSFCSSQDHSPIPDACEPYVPTLADYVTTIPVPVPDCPNL